MSTPPAETRPQLLFAAREVTQPLIAAGRMLLILLLVFGVLAMASKALTEGSLPCFALLALVFVVGVGMSIFDRHPARVCLVFSDRLELTRASFRVGKTQRTPIDRVRHVGLRSGGVLRLIVLQEDSLGLDEIDLAVGRLQAEDRFDQLVELLEERGAPYSVRNRKGHVEWSGAVDWRAAFGPDKPVERVDFRPVPAERPPSHVRVDLVERRWRIEECATGSTCCLGTETGVYTTAGLMIAAIESGGAEASVVRFVGGEAFLVDFRAESIGRETDDPKTFQRAGRFLFQGQVLVSDERMLRSTLLILAAVRSRLLVARDPSDRLLVARDPA